MDRRPTSAPKRPWLPPDVVVLPTVTVLLLVGAVFVALAWDGARDAVGSAASVDAGRADRNARAVATFVQGRERDLEQWADEHAAGLAPGRGRAQLGRELDAWADGSAGGGVLARLVVRADGVVVAIGEPVPGQVASNGINDDLRAFARTVAARGTSSASGRMLLGDRTVFAIGAPMGTPLEDGGGDEGATPAAVVTAYDVDATAIGAFFPRDGENTVDAVTLRDDRARIIAGRPSDPEVDETVTRRVEGTPWRLVLARERVETLLPVWTYPLFASLLVALAIGYAVQEVTRRRFRRIGDERVRQVRALYELATGMLHAETQAAQAEQLATSSLSLVDVDGACVSIASMPGVSPVTAGRIEAGMRQYRVAITGPHAPLGELVVSRTHASLDDEERNVVQTAATLAGAAMHTAATIETERAAAAELQLLDELRSNLLATVAHELRSPLTAVKGVLGLLSMQDDLSSRTREYVDLATSRTDRLVALIQDLFDCSLLETGQLDIRPQRQAADELLDAALGAQAAARPGELVLSATQNLMITVDPVRFDQLVNNLVTNAFRHGSAPVEVSVRPTPEGVVIVVSDEGPGIAAADRDRIFEKFWQGSSGHARMVEGAGLGLSLVHGLVALHGGRIEIDSTHADGRGARFTIWLPDVVPDVVASA